MTQQLQRDVLERERRPVRQAQDMQPALQRLQRRDLVAAEDARAVGSVDDTLQVGHVVHVEA
jgi:hypothetical protein